MLFPKAGCGIRGDRGLHTQCCPASVAPMKTREVLFYSKGAANPANTPPLKLWAKLGEGGIAEGKLVDAAR